MLLLRDTGVVGCSEAQLDIYGVRALLFEERFMSEEMMRMPSWGKERRKGLALVDNCIVPSFFFGWEQAHLVCELVLNGHS